MRQLEKVNEREMPNSCCKSLTDVCALHPVDCNNCQSGRVCQQRKDMQMHPDKIKSCPHFTPTPSWKPKPRGKGSLDAY